MLNRRQAKERAGNRTFKRPHSTSKRRRDGLLLLCKRTFDFPRKVSRLRWSSGRMATALGASAFTGVPVQQCGRRRAACRAACVVEAATSKQTKAQTIERLAAKLTPEAQTTFVAGLNYKGFTVRRDTESEPAT